MAAAAAKSFKVPRSVFWLIALLVVAGGVLAFLRSRPETPDYTLGGALFTTPLAEVDGLLLTRGGAQYRLDKRPTGQWTLDGAVEDYLDQSRVRRLLEQLLAATGGRLLAGSQPEDRRYDFNGPGAMRLTLFAADGSSEKLAVGTRNPVTGGWYASGVGRPACFPISEGLHEVLKGIPGQQRLDQLLPLADASVLTRVEVQRGSTTDVLVKRQGRWLLEWPATGKAALGGPYLAYAAHYGDREMTADNSRWVLADAERVELLIYECSGVSSQSILAPGDAARLLADLDGGSTWRRVRLLGPGINPDPGEGGDPDLLEIDFLPPGDARSQPVRRRNTVLLAELEAANTLGRPLSHLVDMHALAFEPGLADSLHLWREGSLMLRAHRDEQASALPRRIQRRPVDYWLLDQPTPEQTGQEPLTHHSRATNFLVDLARTPILKTLPPTASPEVLQDAERLKLVFYFSDGPDQPGVGRGRVELHVGFLDAARLPAGAADLAIPPDGMEPVGLWRPDTGQLLQITGHPITTARAWKLR